MYERFGGISAGHSTGGYGCRMRRSASRQVCVPQEKLVSGSSLAEWISVWVVATLVERFRGKIGSVKGFSIKLST